MFPTSLFMIIKATCPIQLWYIKIGNMRAPKSEDKILIALWWLALSSVINLSPSVLADMIWVKLKTQSMHKTTSKMVSVILGSYYHTDDADPYSFSYLMLSKAGKHHD